MCFSAEASFSLSTLLFFTGFLTLKNLPSKRYLMVALIPLFFAIQQFAEGIVWLSLTHSWGANVTQIASYSFLFFAYFVWPVWIPLSILCFKSSANQKILLIGTFVIGVSVVSALFYYLIIGGIEASIVKNHIVYINSLNNLLSKELIFMGLALYIIATIAPFFIVKEYGLWFFGLLASIFAAISAYISIYAFGSIWCFFAAILSILIYFIEKKLPRD